MTTTQTPTLEHLRDLVLSVTEPGLSESVRASRARTVSETLADLRDVAGIAAAVIGGSQARDVLDASRPEWAFRPGQRTESVQAAATERYLARQATADLLRATQLTTDTPGLLPRPVDVGTGTTGIGAGLPLVRQYAQPRDFAAGGTVPVTPGVVAGDVSGDVRVEGAAPPAGTPFTIDDVGAARNRVVATAVATFANQIRDWADPVALAMLDQIMLDIADRAGETHLCAQLVAGAGGTRVAGADNTTLGAALDAAEAAAGGAVDGGGLLLLAHPTNWPRIRRAIAASWTEGLPRPAVAASAGMTAGTAAVVAFDAMQLFAADVIWLTAPRPAQLGAEVSANRPLYLSIRKAAGVQTVTGIPA